MKKAVFCIIICLFNLPAVATDYNDFPPNLQQILDERIAEANANGGICVAGQVTMSDDVRISSGKDIMVNLFGSLDEPLLIYDGGWFIMRDTYRSGDNTRLWKIVLRAFGYDPIDASVAIMQGRITYAEFVMDKTPSGKLASISGTIVNEQNEPIDGARISLSFPFAYNVRNDEPRISMNTGSDGQYSFENLSTTEYDIVVLAPGYASISNHVILSAGKTIIKNIKLYYNWNIIIDYVYQADGSRNFTGGNLQTGTIEWINGTGGADFSDGKVEQYEPNSLRDIEMIQGQGDLEFRIVYVNGKNGFYDAGDAAFESVTEAAESGYSGKGKPCVVGHVYIVRTYEDKYAKFVVRDILESK